MQSTEARSGWRGVAVWVVLALILPALKWTQAPSWSMFLWAEDADLFLRQGIDLGPSSLLTPYAGYFHLFTRSVAWLATCLPAAFYPVVMALGWGLVYFGTLLQLVRWTRLMRLPPGGPWQS